MVEESRYLENLAAAVASGSTVRAAVVGVGCSESCGYRLASSPEFKSRVSELRTAAVSLAVGKLSELALSSVATMEVLLSSDDDSVKLRSAMAILDRFAKLSESVDLRCRVEKLELERKQ